MNRTNTGFALDMSGSSAITPLDDGWIPDTHDEVSVSVKISPWSWKDALEFTVPQAYLTTGLPHKGWDAGFSWAVNTAEERPPIELLSCRGRCGWTLRWGHLALAAISMRLHKFLGDFLYFVLTCALFLGNP